MTDKVDFKSQNEDPGFLVAKGKFSGTQDEKDNKEKDHRNKLANAVYMAIVNHGYAHIRAIGTNAIANAVRAIVLASERCKKRDVSLMWECILEKGNLGPIREGGHVQNVVAYTFKIKDWVEGKHNE